MQPALVKPDFVGSACQIYMKLLGLLAPYSGDLLPLAQPGQPWLVLTQFKTVQVLVDLKYSSVANSCADFVWAPFLALYLLG